jgi:hypothetical protein
MIQCDSVITSDGGDATPGGETEATMLVGLIRILLDLKMKKIHMIDSAGTNKW